MTVGLATEGFVLAGGRSSRMGQDKALLRFNGRSLIEGALEKLRSLPLAAPPRIVGMRPDLADFAPVLEDRHPGCGPLGGIAAALEATSTPYNVFLPVDLPLLPARLIAWMLQRAGMTGALATFPRINGMPQPLCLVCHRDALPRLRQALDSGKFALTSAFAPSRVEPSRGFEWSPDIFNLEMLASVQPGIYDFSPLPMVHWFLNCNSPADLRVLASIAAGVL